MHQIRSTKCCRMKFSKCIIRLVDKQFPQIMSRLHPSFKLYLDKSLTIFFCHLWMKIAGGWEEEEKKLTLRSKGLMETARARTRTSVGFRSGTLTAGWSSRASGPPNLGRSTALADVDILRQWSRHAPAIVSARRSSKHTAIEGLIKPWWKERRGRSKRCQNYNGAII